MRLPAVPGVTPVPLGSVDETAGTLLDALRRVKGRDAARDPALEIAASQAAELAHAQRAGLVALVEHPDADPALLVAWMVVNATGVLDAGAAHELGRYLGDAGGPDLHEVTHTRTARGYPTVIAERIQVSGAQLQVVVADVDAPRVAVFTLHSPTGRGWLELAAVAGQFVTGLDFGAAAGTAPASARRPAGTSGRSAPR